MKRLLRGWLAYWADNNNSVRALYCMKYFFATTAHKAWVLLKRGMGNEEWENIMQIKFIFKTKFFHLASFWKWNGPLQFLWIRLLPRHFPKKPFTGSTTLYLPNPNAFFAQLFLDPLSSLSWSYVTDQLHPKVSSFSGFGYIKGYRISWVEVYEREKVSAKNWNIKGKVLPDIGAEPPCIKRGGAAGISLHGNQK